MTTERLEHPIKDYAIIGNCETAALINPHGDIDWLPLPAFDSPTVFASLLDFKQGGFFSIRPAIPYRVEQEYEDDSAILKTRFLTAGGTVELIDFFVIARRQKARFFDFTSLHPTRKLVRLIRSDAREKIPMRLVLDARPDYARAKFSWKDRSGPSKCFVAEGIYFYSSFLVNNDNQILNGSFEIGTQQNDFVVLDYSSTPQSPELQDVLEWFRVTQSFWKEWNLFNYYKGTYQKEVRRSAVTLKLLTYAPTGAFVAAPTTSLPEKIGGDQNWDYRFAWVRDTFLLISTLFRLGYSGEAKAFLQFIGAKCLEDYSQHKKIQGIRRTNLKVLYGIREDSETREKHLEHLRGYRKSVPIRIGNSAAKQLQIDNYGYIMEALTVFLRTGGRINKSMKEMIKNLAEEILDHWHKTDSGIWEVSEKKHYTYSKLMAWVALRHAGQLLSSPQFDNKIKSVSDEIYREIMHRGVRKNQKGGYLAESYDDCTVDASALLAFTSGFLDRETAETTRQKIEEDLSDGPFIYRNKKKKDLEKEGAFLLCSFWWINHLIKEGHLERAENNLLKLIQAANSLGLYAEEIDPKSGEFLGNFPQAYSHLGLINAVLNIEESKRTPDFNKLPESEKFKQSIGATVGWKGVFAGFFRVPKTFYLLFSNNSKWKNW